MSKENPNEFKIINKNERLKYRQIINQLKQQLAEKDKDIDFLKTLIIKLDITIEAERNNVSADGLMLIFDFTEKNRKESITKALDILNRMQESEGE